MKKDWNQASVYHLDLCFELQGSRMTAVEDDNSTSYLNSTDFLSCAVF